MSMLRRFKDHLSEKQYFFPHYPQYLAVSGGVDSVVLCELCHQAGIKFKVAHCNFQLRREESERDETFVKQLAKKYKAQVFVKRFETEKYAADKKISIQEAARTLRYEWFEELIYGHEFTEEYTRINDCLPPGVKFLTAHHADDHIETVLMNFCRGTGLKGLKGIPDDINFISRPMLIFSKKEILDFANEHKLEFVEDSSNQSEKYTRNVFRNEIIPAIENVYPSIKENLLNTIERFTEIDHLYKLAVSGIKKKLGKHKGNEWHIPVKQLMQYKSRALIYELISDYGFSEKQIDEVVKLAASESGKYIDSPEQSHRIIKHRHWLIISPVSGSSADTIIINQEDTSIEFEKGVLQLKTIASQKPDPSPLVACLDTKKIVFPLILRKHRAGDYFYPLGMRKKKKLARFFIDLKLSKTEKENTWVLESANRIIWVLGHRIDDRFRITGKTALQLQIRLQVT